LEKGQGVVKSKSCSSFLLRVCTQIKIGRILKKFKPILIPATISIKTPKLKCFFDGACRPTNPGGWIGYGWVIKEGDVILQTKSGYMRPNTLNSNNVAEYMAMNDLLNYLLMEGLQDELIEIYGDSMLVVKQCNGYWCVKSGMYKEQAIQCMGFLEKFSNVAIRWIPRESNEEADAESNRELDRMGVPLFHQKLKSGRMSMKEFRNNQRQKV
jgi:ribonuclease HI